MKDCNRIIVDKECNIIIQDDFDKNYINIYIIKHTDASGNITSMITLKTKESDQIVCDFKVDGNYSICKIDVPLDETNPYYYKDGKFYKNIKEVELNEVISVNPEISKLNFSYDNYFSTCHLWQCYIKICQEIFDKRASIKCDTTNVDQETIYKRDLLNSAINVINYMASLGQYVEAQRLLERISGCNGLCNTGVTTNGCGCM